ncbi:MULTISPECIES: YitT family protein [unclassified Gemella]|uniref:YitT family protein n=1 Tax=unclassified Gemella TaxID=2624949 RepID=UPI0010734F5B|nr:MULTISPECIES: YitT family protein [unclassified Gemella]MBF0709838.1 YitT family protein [Gemella sp. GL1.1]MBF0746857.1 YitT family protein [Gemella sp. 19428wG2_WT2a]NYS27182.1 YitT family protein [Gemella sp. GL1]TFU59580.1 YitT family protein [Gemella sp. WT2a]
MLKKINYKEFIKKLLLISLGSAIYAFAFTHFIIPSRMAEGGGTGIALLIYYITGLQTSIGTLLVNIPLFILGYKLIDKKTMLFTLYGIVMLTLWIGFFEQYQIIIDLGGDRLLAALFGGIVAGAGLAIVFLNGGSTGGIDILAIIINKYYNIPIGKVIYILDAIIILGTLLVVREFPPILYTLIYIYILAKILDHLLEGGLPGKAVMIISPNIEEISQEISSNMERGMTFLKGEGSYSRKGINIGYCVVSVKEIKAIKEIIYKIDKEAFVTINNVQDIMGEGFSFKPKGR